jgi:hypothetical protein
MNRWSNSAQKLALTLALSLLWTALPGTAGAEQGALPSAESLGIMGTDEAALVLTGTAGLQRILLASTVLTPNEGPLLVRALSEGLLSLQLESTERIWEGSVRVYAGQLTSFDVAAALISPKSQERQAEAFDLFDFYDRMDQLSSLVAKLAWCQTILLVPPPAPDDALVTDLCARLQRRADLATKEPEEQGEPDDEGLGEALATEEGDEEDRRLAALQKLYRADGRLRRHAPGTPLRLGVAGLGFAGSAAGVGLALAFEVDAERQYLLYRSAERLGDDPAMTRHLFLTQDYDRRRDGAIGMAVASLTTGIVALLFQRLEAKRFARYRSSIEDSKDTK